MKVVTFGCDPEVFLKDPTGKIRSAIGLFGGTKEKPEPLKTLGEGYAVQEDNVLMEFNIPPAQTPEIFVESVQKTIALLSKRAAVHGLSFASGSAYSLDPKELEHPKAKVFGCDPDYNAYTGEKNPPPMASDPCLRSAGGHIAVGFDCFPLSKEFEKNKKDIDRYVVREMDMLLAIPFILLDDGLLRKQLYGKAGAFRPKPYGVEYRSLSNSWVFTPDIIKTLLHSFKERINSNTSTLVREPTAYIKATARLHEMAEVAINTNDRDYAKWFLRKYYYCFNQSCREMFYKKGLL